MNFNKLMVSVWVWFLFAGGLFAADSVLMDSDELKAMKDRWHDLNVQQYKLRAENKMLQERSDLYEKLKREQESLRAEIELIKKKVDFLKHRIVRTWTSANGTQIMGRLVSDTGLEVIIERADGTEIKAPRDMLSSQDRDYLDFIAGKTSRSVDPYKALLQQSGPPSSSGKGTPQDKINNFLEDAMKKTL